MIDEMVLHRMKASEMFQVALDQYYIPIKNKLS